MVAFVKYTRSAVRLTGFASDFPAQFEIAPSFLERFTVNTQGSVSFEIACSERNFANDWSNYCSSFRCGMDSGVRVLLRKCVFSAYKSDVSEAVRPVTHTSLHTFPEQC